MSDSQFEVEHNFDKVIRIGYGIEIISYLLHHEASALACVNQQCAEAVSWQRNKGNISPIFSEDNEHYLTFKFKDIYFTSYFKVISIVIQTIEIDIKTHEFKYILKMDNNNLDVNKKLYIVIKISGTDPTFGKLYPYIKKTFLHTTDKHIFCGNSNIARRYPVNTDVDLFHLSLEKWDEYYTHTHYVGHMPDQFFPCDNSIEIIVDYADRHIISDSLEYFKKQRSILLSKYKKTLAKKENKKEEPFMERDIVEKRVVSTLYTHLKGK
jgi:hypothetical protein